MSTDWKWKIIFLRIQWEKSWKKEEEIKIQKSYLLYDLLVALSEVLDHDTRRQKGTATHTHKMKHTFYSLRGPVIHNNLPGHTGRFSRKIELRLSYESLASVSLVASGNRTCSIPASQSQMRTNQNTIAAFEKMEDSREQRLLVNSKGFGRTAFYSGTKETFLVCTMVENHQM